LKFARAWFLLALARGCPRGFSSGEAAASRAVPQVKNNTGSPAAAYPCVAGWAPRPRLLLSRWSSQQVPPGGFDHAARRPLSERE